MNQKNSNGNEGRAPYQPMVQLTGVWECESANGNKYFTGRLGASKILILRNKLAGQEGQPDWNIMVQTPTPKPTDAAPATSLAPHRYPNHPARRAG